MNPSEQAYRHAHIRERGILLATLGLLLAIAIAFTLESVQTGTISMRELALAIGGVLALQAVSLAIVRSGLAARLSWDPHYILVPCILGTIELNYVFYFAPAANPLIFVAWVVSMLFIAGLAGFSAVFGMSALMAFGYLIVSLLFVERGEPVSLRYQSIIAVSFLALGVYTGVIFERLRRDRAERRELRHQLSRLAFTDPLTDLPNRRHFEQVINAEIARIGRYGGVCSVAMFDVDHFKNYNDTLGHPAGDEVLRRLATLMKDHIRNTDFLARYGGEEFALLMVNTSRREAAQGVQRIIDAVEAHPFPDEHVQPGGHLTISAGIATAPEDGGEPAEIIRASDVALYDAKRKGRNRVVA
jgi:diguanylate cyclase (GGDEF)-like protein